MIFLGGLILGLNKGRRVRVRVVWSVEPNSRGMWGTEFKKNRGGNSWLHWQNFELNQNEMFLAFFVPNQNGHIFDSRLLLYYFTYIGTAPPGLLWVPIPFEVGDCRTPCPPGLSKKPDIRSSVYWNRQESLTLMVTVQLWCASAGVGWPAGGRRAAGASHRQPHGPGGRRVVVAL